MANRGDFIWEDLLTSNTATAATFYAKVAGLKTAPSTVNKSYITFAGSAGPIGGLMALPGDAKKSGERPSWMSYISCENVEETARHAESLGGKVLKPPSDVGDGGRSAVLQDPQGASFLIYASSHPLEPATTVPLGGIYWHELITTDYKAAFDFYQQLFGWTIANDMNMGDVGVYRIFGTATMPKGAGGIYNKAAQQPGPPMWLPYIHVASVEKAADVAKSIGAKIMHGPADVPGGRIVIGTDPQGAMFALYATAVSKDTKAAAAKRTKKKTAAKKKTSPKKAAKKAKRRVGPKK